MALLEEYQVGVDGSWSERQAAHLFRRAGFGATPDERISAVGDGSQDALRATIDQLVNFQLTDPHLDQAATGGAPNPGAPFADLNNSLWPTFNLAEIADPQNEIEGIAHWLYRMRYTSQPLQEQMTLFLHDHMVTEGDKLYNVVPDFLNLGNDGGYPGQPCTTGTLPYDALRLVKTIVNMMLTQNKLFRETGVDDFRQLVINITRNPAMLIYLDNIFNVNGRPQENFAREVLELFTMGVGNYSENDIREIAKCLTGETFPNFNCESDWSLEYGFFPFTHEPGTKTVFGQTIQNSFSSQETIDVIDLIMNKTSVNPDVSGLGAPYNDLPATAVYMSWKLLRWFVNHTVQLSPVPDAAVLELADYMRGTDNGVYPQRRFRYDIRACLRKIFLSKYFYDESNFFAMIKNPAELLVSSLRVLGLHEKLADPGFGPNVLLLLMGMRLFNPPNVAGWNHGNSWMTSGNVIVRYIWAFKTAYALNPYADATEYPMNQNVFDLLSDNGGPLQGFNDHEGMLEYYRARLIQDDLAQDEHDTLIEFLDTMPGTNDFERYVRKILGLIHVMMTMPKFQAK